jgi:hypothetical protein
MLQKVAGSKRFLTPFLARDIGEYGRNKKD